MEVYAEVVALINFLVDFLLLLGTGKLTGQPQNRKRAAWGAALGAGYAYACLLPGFSFLANGFWRRVSFLGISVVTFGTGIAGFRRGILFFLLSMALGGLAGGLGGGGIRTLLLSATVLGLLCLWGFGTDAGAKYRAVTITHGGKAFALTALADTGNTLRDPISGDPVLVADARAARELLGLGEQALSDPMGTLADGKIPGLRLIPYHAVGNPGGLLLAFRPEKLTCDGRETSMVVAFAPHLIGENKVFCALAGGCV